MSGRRARRPRRAAQRVAPVVARPEPPVAAPPARDATRHAAAALVVVALLAAYAWCAGRSVGTGDSGELTVAMTGWGVPHAPAFPLLVLLGNLVSHLPHPGEPAWIANLLNALFAALTCGVLAAAVTALTDRPWAGLVAGLALGVSRIFWEYALVVEVFALNALMAALLLLFLARFLRGLADRRPVLWPLPASALVMSATLTHHTTLALLAVPLLMVYASLLPGLARRGVAPAALRRTLVHCALAALAGLLPLAYVPVAARFDPPLNWGEVHDLASFVHLLTRRDFGIGILTPRSIVVEQLMLHGEDASPLGLRHLRLLATDLPRSLGPIFPFVALLGLPWAARRQPRLLLLAGLALAAIALFYSRVNAPVVPVFVGITRPFRILPHLVLAFFGGLGAAWLMDRTRRLGARWSSLAVALLGAAVVVPLGIGDLREVRVRDDTFTRDLGDDLLAGLPRDAILFTSGDLMRNALHYQQVCLGERRDVTVVELPMMRAPWYMAQLARRGAVRLPPPDLPPSSASRAWLDANLGPAAGTRRPVAATEFYDGSWRAAYRMVPMGLWSRLVPAAERPRLRAMADACGAAVAGWATATLAREYPPTSWQATDGIALTSALGSLQALRDLADTFDPAGGPPPVVPALAVAARWSGARRADYLACQAEFWRGALRDSLVPASARAESLVVARVLELTRASLALDSTDLRALQTRATLLRRVSRLRNPQEEVRLRRRIVAQRPGDLNELFHYFAAVGSAMGNPATRDPRLLAEAESVRRRYVDLLGTAMRLWDEPELGALRARWSAPLRETGDPRLATP